MNYSRNKSSVLDSIVAEERERYVRDLEELMRVIRVSELILPPDTRIIDYLFLVFEILRAEFEKEPMGLVSDALKGEDSPLDKIIHDFFKTVLPVIRKELEHRPKNAEELHKQLLKSQVTLDAIAVYLKRIFSKGSFFFPASTEFSRFCEEEDYLISCDSRYEVVMNQISSLARAWRDVHFGSLDPFQSPILEQVILNPDIAPSELKRKLKKQLLERFHLQRRRGRPKKRKS